MEGVRSIKNTYYFLRLLAKRLSYMWSWSNANTIFFTKRLSASFRNYDVGSAVQLFRNLAHTSALELNMRAAGLQWCYYDHLLRTQITYSKSRTKDGVAMMD